jgi:hypothetical protein
MDWNPDAHSQDVRAQQRSSPRGILAAPQRRARAAVMLISVLVVMVTTTTAVAAQTLPGGGGPSAVGMVTSVSGTTIDLQGANGGSNATVTLTGSTTYQKTETAPSNAIAPGTCVRVVGKGSTAKGITANSVSITTASQPSSSSTASPPSSGGCGAGAGFGNGGLPGAGSGQAPSGNGSAPQSRPSGSLPPGNGNRQLGGIAFGTVQSINGNQLVVNAQTLAARPKQGSTPKLKAQKVKVTLSSSTSITQTVTGTASDVTTGRCLFATGTGDSSAVTADSVRISDAQNGSCIGGFSAGGAPPGATQ